MPYGNLIRQEVQRFADYDDLDVLTDVMVTNNDPGTNNDISIVFNGLNITSGDFWLHLGFDAFTGPPITDGKWTNTKENLLGITAPTAIEVAENTQKVRNPAL